MGFTWGRRRISRRILGIKPNIRTDGIDEQIKNWVKVWNDKGGYSFKYFWYK